MLSFTDTVEVDERPADEDQGLTFGKLVYCTLFSWKFGGMNL